MKKRKYKNRGGIRKLFLSLVLCVAMLFGVFGPGPGTYDADAATGVTKISDSYYAKSKISQNLFNFNAKTFSSYKFTGVSGKVLTGTDSGGNSVKALCIPVQNKAFSYTDFLDVYYKNVGAIAGRSVNAQVHFNSLKVSAPYAPTPENTSGLFCVTYLSNSLTEICSNTNGKGPAYFNTEFGWRAASTFDVTVTFTYADTNETVDLRMFLCASDIDAGTATTFTEGFEGVSGFTGELYCYQSNINTISGLKVLSSYTATSGSDSWLKNGVYAKTSSGMFRCKFYEGNCGTALQVYCPYSITDEPDKKAKEPDTVYNVGDTVQYSITQDVLTYYTETFDTYTSMSFYDNLPESLDYVQGSARLYDDGADVTGSYGTLSYDSSTRKLTYTLKASVLNNIKFYDGGELKFVFDTVVNENAVTSQSKDGTIKNTAVVNICGVDFESNMVTVAVAGTGYIKKADAQTDEAVAGAVYYVYTDKACTARAKDTYGKQSFFTTTAETPYSNGISYKQGTYYVKEYSAPDGYLPDDTVHTLVIKAGESSYVDAGQVYDDPYGTLIVQKISGNESLTDGNSCYSLAGAEYGVYTKQIDAQNDTNRVATLTTGENGETDPADLVCNKYYVKEVTASPGYMLCDGMLDDANDGIHEVTIKQYETSTVECTEPPANDPFALQLQKLDYDTGEAAAEGTASLAGAIFSLEYYTNTDGSANGDPFKTWYFRTDEDGKFDCRNLGSLVASYTMNDGTVLASDELYENMDGEVVYPVGTYRVREISSPMYYQNEGCMQFRDSAGQISVVDGLTVVIKQDENGGAVRIYDGDNLLDDRLITAANLAVNVYDKVERGSITLYKQEADGSETPLSGVTFRLAGLEEGDEYTVVTDEDGKAVWDCLVPQNYVITEIETVDGYSLLKDEIKVTLPLEMTLDEINESGADISKAVYDEASGKYCFYDLAYTVGNSATFDVPVTGGDQGRLYIVFAAGVVIVAIGASFMFKKKKARRNTSE